jgi:hypothetical protein
MLSSTPQLAEGRGLACSVKYRSSPSYRMSSVATTVELVMRGAPGAGLGEPAAVGGRRMVRL